MNFDGGTSRCEAKESAVEAVPLYTIPLCHVAVIAGAALEVAANVEAKSIGMYGVDA